MKLIIEKVKQNFCIKKYNPGVAIDSKVDNMWRDCADDVDIYIDMGASHSRMGAIPPKDTTPQKLARTQAQYITNLIKSQQK